jgi:hypothetical protein
MLVPLLALLLLKKRLNKVSWVALGKQELASNTIVMRLPSLLLYMCGHRERVECAYWKMIYG